MSRGAPRSPSAPLARGHARVAARGRKTVLGRQTGAVLRWVAASTVGFAIAGAILHFPGSFPPGSGELTFQPGAAVGGAVMGFVSGLVPGALLWWAARPRASWMLIPATALGVGLCHALGDGLPANVDYLFIGLAAGAVLGFAQLRSFRDPPDTIVYVAGSALGLAAGLTVGLAAAGATGLMAQAWTPSVGAQQHTLVSAIAGAFWAFATGRALLGVRLLPAT